jgi:site-specific DNA-methyltransferase (adenine-specific)
VTATATDVTPGSPPGEAAPAVYPGGHEPIVLARKPLAGTVAGNVLAYGTGALNVEGCRVAHNEPDGKPAVGQGGARRGGIMGEHPETLRARETTAASTDGRWPPNVLLTHAAGCEPGGTIRVRASQPAVFHRAAAENDGNTSAAYGVESRPEGHVTPGYGDADGMETVDAWECAPGCPVAEIDRQSGTTRSSGGSGERSGRDGRGGGFTQTVGHNAGGLGDEGGASRFYPVLDWTPAELEFAFAYTAKAAAAERPGKVGADDEAHPTVKPLALCLWLARLVTPPGGRIVDPFAGTGPVLEAAAMLGMSGVGCDNWQVAVDSAVLRLSDIGGRDRKIRARRPRVRAGDTLW